MFDFGDDILQKHNIIFLQMLTTTQQHVGIRTQQRQRCAQLM